MDNVRLVELEFINEIYSDEMKMKILRINNYLFFEMVDVVKYFCYLRERELKEKVICILFIIYKKMT